MEFIFIHNMTEVTKFTLKFQDNPVFFRIFSLETIHKLKFHFIFWRDLSTSRAKFHDEWLHICVTYMCYGSFREAFNFILRSFILHG